MPQDNTVLIEDADLVFRNFAGREGMYNREGDRSFAVKLSTELADALAADGWNVKTLRARDEDESPQPYLQVSVGYKGRPPTIILISSRGRTPLDEDTVETLDQIDIQRVDLIIRPFDWTVRENTGRKAYLQSMYVTMNEDALALKYNDIATVDGPMMEKTGPYVPSTH
jgi:hypothetical protein